ncbi:putative F420-0 ABC transporter substrate-binding protein [Myceligenerans sp. TRM 65318]|uniref:F420-0 ABC transporter substrate-binding protein n=1 Tax=Myceligenerans pegani TaxID=2776917 RepID=A0ABR9MXZ5_9MICO|nr:putative F420-0 ABC transporter substrate-binding protein [Myceligenerans sp. TRM 65318]MBE3018529.1 putative F420-0 ABC transporter substrate-binding protein [Myceligenerans sp. TRM 65318]
MPAVVRTTARPAAAATALAAAAVLALAGCSSATSGTDGSPDDGGPASDTFPVRLDNCGFAAEIPAPPERVVTIKSSTTEMLLALGLGDRIVGTAFLDGPVPESLTDAAADVPALAEPLTDEAPGSEAVLELEPDLIYAGWESNLTAETAGDRETLAALGVATYVSPAACKDPAYMPNPLTFDHVFGEIEEIGRVFGAEDAAADLVAEQRSALAAIEPDDRGLTALWYSSGDDVPYVGAGIGAPQMIMDAAGLENVAADVRDTWTSFAWEEAVAADPDVIVLVDAAWNTAEAKRERLAENPATAEMTAVRNENYVVVPFPATEAGVRNVDAAADVVDQLGALGR